MTLLQFQPIIYFSGDKLRATKVGRQKVISCEIIEQHAEDLFIYRGVEKKSVNELVKTVGIAKETFVL